MNQRKDQPANEHAELPDWLLGFFLVAVTFVAYQPVWHAGFIWDDDAFVTDNPVFKSANCLYRLWFTASTLDYYPMTFSMLWMEWRLWGNHPLGYHLMSILLHAFSAMLLWRVLQRLKIPGALLAAAIFALHPVNVESVAWISEGKNTLCMFFYLGALLAWLQFEDSRRGRWYGLALAAFALSLFSKTAAAPLPLVLLGVAWWRRGRVEWKDVWLVVPFLALAATVCRVTVWFHYHRAIGHEVVRTDGFWSRLAGAGWAVWFYLYKALLPLKLIFVYPRWQINARSVLSYVPLALLAAAFVLCWRWRKGWFFALAYFVAMLLPILGFLNIYFMRYSLVADHWEYFAIIGPVAVAAALIKRPGTAAAVLLALGALTWQQSRMYVNAETLWRTTLRRNPDCWMAHNNLGNILREKGQVDEAIAHLQKALEIEPGNAEVNNNLGNALRQKGRVDDAIIRYQKALQLNPEYAAAHLDLGIALDRKGRLDEAISQYQQALRLKPQYAKARNNLGSAFLQKGNPIEAIVNYKAALQIEPGDVGALNNLAWALATCAQASLRHGDQAVELARQANTLTRGEDPIILRTLAAALAEAGQFSEAVETAQRAMHAAENQSNTKLAGMLQSEMILYQGGKSFQSPAPAH